jgi:hypothetical protein
MLEHALVPGLGHGGFKRHVQTLQEGVEAHQPQTDGALTRGGILRALHLIGRTLDEVLQDIVEEAEDVFEETRIVFPLEEFLGVQRGQAAHGRAVIAQVVDAGRQGDFRTQVGLAHLQAQLALVGGHVVVHRVGEQDVGLAGLQAHFQNLLPQLAGVDGFHHLAGRGEISSKSSSLATASMNASDTLRPW